MATASSIDSLKFNQTPNLPTNRKQTYNQLKQQLTEKYGFTPSSTKGYKKYRAKNRVYDENTKTYVDRNTGKTWNDKTIKSQLKSDTNTLRDAGKPISINRLQLRAKAIQAQNRLQAHDEFQNSLVGKTRRFLSDRTLQGNKKFDTEQAALRTKLENRLSLAQNALPYKPSAAELSILNRQQNFGLGPISEEEVVKLPGQEVGAISAERNGKFRKDSPNLGLNSRNTLAIQNSAERRETGETTITTGDKTKKGEEVIIKDLDGTPKGESKLPVPQVGTVEGSPTGSNVFTRHFETGETLGVMTRAQRRAYDKKAAGKKWEGPRKRLLIGDTDYGN